MRTYSPNLIFEEFTGPVVVDFWAPWCVPCRTTKPVLEGLAEEYKDSVHFISVNADEQPGLVDQYGIKAIPTVIAMQAGNELSRYVGAQTKAKYRSLFQSLADGTPAFEKTIAPGQRWLRLTAGTILTLLALQFGNIFLGIVGAGVIFAAVYDRCPLWKALIRRIQ